MSIEQSKFPQSVDQKDRNLAFGFSESLARIPGKTEELSKIFANAFGSRYSSKA